jgi:hypothetical protein
MILSRVLWRSSFLFMVLLDSWGMRPSPVTVSRWLRYRLRLIAMKMGTQEIVMSAAPATTIQPATTTHSLVPATGLA